jgi:hypothetical protein
MGRHVDGVHLLSRRVSRTSVEESDPSMDIGKPVAEILVEGELSLFEHEALYKR